MHACGMSNAYILYLGFCVLQHKSQGLETWMVFDLMMQRLSSPSRVSCWMVRDDESATILLFGGIVLISTFLNRIRITTYRPLRHFLPF